MRWILIDKFVRIEKGRYAKGVRNVTRSEGALVDSYPCYPVMPSSLLVEMMAQVGGVLVGASIDFSREVVLAKVSGAEFPEAITPPASLEIEGRLGELGPDAAMTECEIRCDGRLVAKTNIFFGLFKGLGENDQKSIVFSKDFVESFALHQVMEQPVHP